MILYTSIFQFNRQNENLILPTVEIIIIKLVLIW